MVHRNVQYMLMHDFVYDMCVQQIASHGLFDLSIEAEGDTWIDDHHTNEDLGALQNIQGVAFMVIATAC